MRLLSNGGGYLGHYAVQGSYKTPDGGLSIKNLSVLNPFDPNAKPINLRFSAERPSFQLPQVRLRMHLCTP